MKDNKHIQSFNEHQENLNISGVISSDDTKKLQSRIPLEIRKKLKRAAITLTKDELDVSDSDLINQIKKYKNELLIDLEEMVYTSEQPIPDSFFNLSRLIDKL